MNRYSAFLTYIVTSDWKIKNYLMTLMHIETSDVAARLKICAHCLRHERQLWMCRDGFLVTLVNPTCFWLLNLWGIGIIVMS